MPEFPYPDYVDIINNHDRYLPNHRIRCYPGTTEDWVNWYKALPPALRKINPRLHANLCYGPNVIERLDKDHRVYEDPHWQTIQLTYRAYAMRDGFDRAGIENWGGGNVSLWAYCCGAVADYLPGHLFTPREQQQGDMSRSRQWFMPWVALIALPFWRGWKHARIPRTADVRIWFERLPDIPS